MQMAFEYNLRRFLKDHPSWVAAVGTTFLTALAYFQVLSLGSAVVLAAVITLLFLAYHFGTVKRRRKENALASLRDAIDCYLVVTNPEDATSPLNIINQMLEMSFSGNAVRKTAADFTYVIHNIIQILLGDSLTECKTALEGQRLEAITEIQVKDMEDKTWRAIDWYHKHVVNQLFDLSFKPFVTQSPRTAPLLSKLCMRYDRAIDMLETARKIANSDCNLNLDIDLDALRIST